jgi:hypothetical protein
VAGQKWLWRVASENSWLLQFASLALITIGGLIANVTFSQAFQNACGPSGFCFTGWRDFFFGTVEGWLLNAGLLLGAVALYASFEDKAKIAELEDELGIKKDELSGTSGKSCRPRQEGNAWCTARPMPTAFAPDEGMAVRVPVDGRAADRIGNLVPGLKPPAC